MFTETQAWIIVFSLFGVFFSPEAALKYKWKSLRDYFALEYSRRPVARSGDGADNQSVSKWQYFKQLLFLKDVITPRASFDSLQASSTNSQESSAECEATERQDEQIPSSVADFQDQPQESTGPSTSQVAGTSSEKRNEVRKRKREKADNYKELLVDIEERKLQYLKEVNKSETLQTMTTFYSLSHYYPTWKWSLHTINCQFAIKFKQFLRNLHSRHPLPVHHKHHQTGIGITCFYHMIQRPEIE